MDVDALKIVMFIARIAVLIVACLVFAGLFSSLKVEFRSADTERFSVEMIEQLTSSPNLTAWKYVFDKDKLDKFDVSAELKNFNVDGRKVIGPDSLYKCGFLYDASVKDLKTDKEWKLSRVDVTTSADRKIDSVENVIFYVGVRIPGSRPGEGTVDPGLLRLSVYSTAFSRMACDVEAAFLTKIVQSETLPKLMGMEKIAPNMLCYTYTIGSDKNYGPCAYTQKDVSVTTFAPSDDQLNEYNTRVIKQGPALKFYPIKKGVQVTCGNMGDIDLDTGGTAYLAGKDDEVGTVLVCIA